MVLDILQRIESVPEELIQRVVKVAQGRPLFIEEILADMAERDIIHVGEEQWSVDLQKALEVSLPQSVEAAILSRVDALPPHGQQALQIAAVVGDVCWEGLVLKMGIPTRFVLEDLQQRQFLRYRRTSQIPDEREFYFVLPAVREAVENHVLKKVKTRLHAAIADWVQARIKQEHEYFDRLLGHHYFEAGQVAKALPMRMRAGQKAELRGDTHRALGDLQWVWKEARGGDDKSLLESEEMLEARVSVARLLRRAGLPEEARKALNETREVFAEASMNSPSINLGLRRAGLEAARALIQAGERPEAAELLLSSLGITDADQPGTRQLAAQANKWRGWIAYLDKQYEEALQLYNEGINLAEPLGPSLELSSLFDGLGVCLSRLERFDEAQQALEKALEYAREVGNRDSQAGIQANLGVLRYRQGRQDEAMVQMREARQAYESIGDKVLAAACRSNVGDVLLEQGKADEARTELEGALAVFRRTRSHDYQIAALQSLLKCLETLGDKEALEQRRAELGALSKPA
jgi:tetratricopeptide (TPR) repeat protein